MQRLGKNLGKYFGEGIDIQRVLAEIEKAAGAHGWNSEVFQKTDRYRLLALKRTVATAERRIYISAGIHGDEPAGPLAVLQLLQENRWPDNASIWLCPCLNPAGFPASSRENAQGIDLNRQYRNAEAEETRAHMVWLQRQPKFDVCLCLHEDWEAAGFYVYELNPDNRPSFAKAIITRVAEVCPIDMSSTIEGRPAIGGVINPSVDPRSRPQWPEAFYLLTHKTRQSYTVEAPSDFQLVTRVAATVAAVRAVLDLISTGFDQAPAKLD
ncbi:MAG TPA: M14 family metallocarboxypeptidase [Verrucomicrobiae bacterium]|nr:M14 family metallocarboxypeptidase [Verrucomicrobiae bacterium]